VLIEQSQCLQLLLQSVAGRGIAGIFAGQKIDGGARLLDQMKRRENCPADAPREHSIDLPPPTDGIKSQRGAIACASHGLRWIGCATLKAAL
jgi:hypothetical protein